MWAGIWIIDITAQIVVEPWFIKLCDIYCFCDVEKIHFFAIIECNNHHFVIRNWRIVKSKREGETETITNHMINYGFRNCLSFYFQTATQLNRSK